MRVRLTKAIFENESKERVLLTEPNQLQLVVVTLQPGESIPMETHKDATQMTRVEYGQALVTVNGETIRLIEGEAIWVPPGTKHEIRHEGKHCGPLRLSTVYSPPQH